MNKQGREFIMTKILRHGFLLGNLEVEQTRKCYTVAVAKRVNEKSQTFSHGSAHIWWTGH